MILRCKAFIVDSSDSGPSLIAYAHNNTHAMFLAAEDPEMAGYHPLDFKVTHLKGERPAAGEAPRVLCHKRKADKEVYLRHGWELSGMKL